MKSFFITAFILLLLAIIVSIQHKESFVNQECPKYKDCASCASTSGCSWCPKNNTCIDSTSLKSTDKDCNQMNSIDASFACTGNTPKSNESNQVMYDFTMFKNKITDRIPPPNVFTTSKMEYAPETVMAATHQIEQDFQRYQTGLPGIIASAMENQIAPMVKGILEENHYIQQ